MKSGLVGRIEDIPGVAAVTVDLEGPGRGIDIRLDAGADEAVVLEELRALLAAYGVPKEGGRKNPVGRVSRRAGSSVSIKITPLQSGARVEAATKLVRSFRIAAAEPKSIAQAVADAWCQVVGRIPVEVTSVSVDDGVLTVTVSDGDVETTGVGSVDDGWSDALVSAVGGALDPEPRSVEKAAS